MDGEPQVPARVVGRYAIYDEIASGGMASVYIGRLLGVAGFARTVAIKRLHSELAKDPQFTTMLLDEARVAACIRHPNVVSTLDVVRDNDELFLVMEYVDGESLSRIRRVTGDRPIPLPTVSAIVTGLLLGLHAAHEAKDQNGEPLRIVHRDVSPHNVLVGTDGTSRVADFGIAKAAGRVQTTREGEVKGKAAYMAPEQLRGEAIDRRADVYAASIVLWELVTGKRLFLGATQAETVLKALEQRVARPRSLVAGVPPALDEVVMRGLARLPEDRFQTALEMATALESAVRPATAREVGAWLDALAGDALHERAQRVASIERSASDRSQTSAFAVATPHRVPSRRRLPWALGVGAALAIVVAGAFAWRKPTTRGAASAPPSASTAAATAEPLPSAATESAPPTASASASAVANPPSKPHPKPRRAGANCSPAYTVDSRGIRVPKPECI